MPNHTHPPRSTHTDPPPQTPPHWLTPAQFGDALGVHPHTVTRLARQYGWPTRGGRSRLWLPTSLLEDWWVSTPWGGRRGGRKVRFLPFPANLLPSLRGLEYRRLLASHKLPTFPMFWAHRPGYFPQLRYSDTEVTQWETTLSPALRTTLESFRAPSPTPIPKPTPSPTT